MDLTPFTAVAVTVTTGLTQFSKIVGLPDRLAPVIEVIVGVALCVAGVASGAVTVAFAAGSAAIFWAVVQGLVAALAAGGVYVYASNAATALRGAPAGPATP